ncbi:39S ribosomal protein L53, mitochondrial-like [Stylophora pistillata]|uniref:39S ribosomal protein L53, mitochondrial-like n=1 Tax=Stylophora pistillata TaxID=50429 RepID=UPI000C05395A|nr:39S ribosomal protein L53, mitochondrial-like [Stylophora pistillata]
MAAIRGASLKHVARVTVSFCPFDSKTATARDFLLRVSCRRMIDSNPKCQVISNFKNDGSEPVVDIVFNDKDTLSMKTSNMKLMDVIATFNNKCKEKDVGE